MILESVKLHLLMFLWFRQGTCFYLK